MCTQRAMADFTVKVTAAVNGKHILRVSDRRAGSLYGRHIKETVSKMVGASSPFCIQLLHGQERFTDFSQLKNHTDTSEIELNMLCVKKRKPTAKEYDALAEAVGSNYPQLVWNILAKGLILPDGIPSRGRMTTNPLAMSLQSPYMELTSDTP